MRRVMGILLIARVIYCYSRVLPQTMEFLQSPIVDFAKFYPGIVLFHCGIGKSIGSRRKDSLKKRSK